MKQLLLLGILLLGLSACAQAGDSLPPTAVLPTAEQSAPPPQPPTAGPTIPAAQPIPTESAGPSAPTPEPPPTAVPTSGPIAVTYFTPAQQEGPYYTLDKPVDRDSDLVDLAGAAGLPAGQILEFDGTVYNAGGLPISGLTIEIWQTDASGIYLHPGDPDTASRDPNFQFYGETITDASGHYSFRTILPGQYEPRAAAYPLQSQARRPGAAHQPILLQRRSRQRNHRSRAAAHRPPRPGRRRHPHPHRPARHHPRRAVAQPPVDWTNLQDWSNLGAV